MSEATDKKIGNLRISGSGSSGGGTFNNVSISGSGTIHGDVDAGNISISGSGKIAGNVKTDSISISGSANVGGRIEAGDVRASGSFSCNDAVRADTISCSGSCKIGGRLNAKKVSLSGSIKVNGDAEAENFYSRGAFNIDGLLNANKVEVYIKGSSYAKEIGGEEIFVRRDKYDWVMGIIETIIGLFSSKASGNLFELRSEQIEGTTVSLEYTRARVVRGSRVCIGLGCNVDQVEYTEELVVHPEARITNKIKI